MKKIIFVLYLLLLCPFCPSLAWGACTEGNECIKEGTTYICPTLELACIQDAHDDASNGDTILLPVGTLEWPAATTSTLKLTKAIKLIGQGKTSTTIQQQYNTGSGINCYTGNLAFSNAACFISFKPNAAAIATIDEWEDTNTFEISNIHFEILNQGSSTNQTLGLCIVPDTQTPIRRVKIHDNKYSGFSGRAVMSSKHTYGVFYKNDLYGPRPNYPLASNNDSWNYYPTTPGMAGNGDSWYVEDNTFYASGYASAFGGGGHGAAWVLRYNTMQPDTAKPQDYWEAHGNQKGGIASTQVIESYGNYLNRDTLQGVNQRGGKLFAFFNHMYDAVFRLWEEYSDTVSGSVYDDKCPENLPQLCNVDGCRCQKANDVYLINNRKISNNSLATTSVVFDCLDRLGVEQCVPYTAPELVENREYFKHNESFDGTVGVGCGAIGNRPNTCTTGVGYWATDQSCTDLTGMVGTNPTTPISGTLYKCTATDTWTEYYTPYTYPHSLRGETPPDPEEGPWLVSVGGDAGCYFVPHNPAYVEDGQTTEVGVYAATNYSVATVSGCGGTWGGEGTYTTAAVTGDCEVACTSKKLSPDTAIGSGAAVKFGVGAGAIVR